MKFGKETIPSETSTESVERTFSAEERVLERAIKEAARSRGWRAKAHEIAKASAFFFAMTMATKMAEARPALGPGPMLSESVEENSIPSCVTFGETKFTPASWQKENLHSHITFELEIADGGDSTMFQSDISSDAKTYRPVRVDGDVLSVTLRLTVPQEIFEKAIGREQEGISVHGGMDEFGNELEIVSITRRGETVVSVSVVPAIPIPSSPEDQFSDLKIGLSSVGLGPISGVIYQRAKKPLRPAQGENYYPVYGSSWLEQTDGDLVSKTGKSTGEGVHRAEELFGYKSGEFMRAIAITMESQINAFNFQGRPDVVILTSAFAASFKDKTGLLEYVGAHETFHGLDKLLGISSRDEFVALHQSLSVEERGSLLFVGTDESEFLRTGFGGHSEDNEKEFFASLMNSLTTQGVELWERNIKNQHSDFLSRYLEALDVLACSLDETVPATAPIHALITERMEIVKKVIEANK